MLKLSNVNIYRGHQAILQNVNAAVQSGQLIAIIGENGAGKSTLLKAVLSEINTTGLICFNGRDLDHYSHAELASQRAVMTQSLSLPFALPISEFVSMGRFHLAEPSKVKWKKVQDAIRVAGLSGYLDRTTDGLSGGEFQRLQFARCLAQIDALDVSTMDTLMLLDEPTSALDLRHQHRLLQTVKHFTRQGNAAMVAMHDLNLAASYADQIWLIDNQTIALTGAPSEVLTPSILSKVYQTPMAVINNRGQPIIYSSASN